MEYEESRLRSYEESQLCSYEESRLHLWNTKKADCVHDHLVRVDAQWEVLSFLLTSLVSYRSKYFKSIHRLLLSYGR